MPTMTKVRSGAVTKNTIGGTMPIEVLKGNQTTIETSIPAAKALKCLLALGLPVETWAVGQYTFSGTFNIVNGATASAKYPASAKRRH